MRHNPQVKCSAAGGSFCFSGMSLCNRLPLWIKKPKGEIHCSERKWDHIAEYPLMAFLYNSLLYVCHKGTMRATPYLNYRCLHGVDDLIRFEWAAAWFCILSSENNEAFGSSSAFCFNQRFSSNSLISSVEYGTNVNETVWERLRGSERWYTCMFQIF